MSKPRSLKKDAEIAVIPGNPLVLRGARNVRSLSAAFIADLQEDWEKSGTPNSGAHCQKNSPIYTLAASSSSPKLFVSKSPTSAPKKPKPKTIEEVLQRVERETGVEGRRAFEGFLKKMHREKPREGRKVDDQCPLFVAAAGKAFWGQRVRRWFVLSAMRNVRSISKLTGRTFH